jgi:hypothetical protein
MKWADYKPKTICEKLRVGKTICVTGLQDAVAEDASGGEDGDNNEIEDND